eukprot:Opistho-2@32942
MASAGGRFLRNLRKMTVEYCPIGGSSEGVRQFLATKIKDVAKDKPEVVFIALRRLYAHPRIIYEYAGKSNSVGTVPLRNMNMDKVASEVDRLCEFGGRWAPKNERKVTMRPSLQGVWTPATYGNLRPPKETPSA